jgi:hypothetical protein
MNTILVRAFSADANAYLSFNYNEVVMRNNDRQRMRAVSEEDSVISTVIEVKSELSSDKMWLFQNEHYSRGFDNGGDGIKIEGNALNTQIFAVENDGIYQINAINDFHNTLLAFRPGQDAEYEMEFTHTNTDRLYRKIFLHDLETNTIADITESGSAYRFSAISAPAAAKRFRIITRPTTEETEDLSSNITIFNAQNTIYIRNTGNEHGLAHVFDIAGRKIATQAIAPNSVSAFNVSYHEAYIVKADMLTENTIKKIIIRH